MKILIIGGGGREHALAWRCAQSPSARAVYVAPGNPGTASEPGVRNVPIAATDLPGLESFATREGIDLAIVGPEAPLVAGVVDRFTTAGIPCFGPTARSAELEGSKAYAKSFLVRHRIPTAAHETFTDCVAALDHVRGRPCPVVIKADGLAAGKGVVVATTRAEAETAIRDMLEGGRFGNAGRRVVVEEFLHGEEASFIVMCDGSRVVPLASSQDHKARDDGDRGPNTGGMGAYSPAPIVDEAMHRRVMDEVILPTVAGMAADGRPYRGFLYAGLMIGGDGTPRVLEFNCRLGDPETQPILMRFRGDLPGLCLAAATGRLDARAVDWDPRSALGVVLAAEGYPGEPRQGDPITGLDGDFGDSVKVFQAGTSLRDQQVVTAGGRVLCVTALGADIADAQAMAYAAVDRIGWPGMFCRRDIGYRAIARQRDPATGQQGGATR